MGRRDVYTATVSFDYDDNYYPKRPVGLKAIVATNGKITHEYVLSKANDIEFNMLVSELTSTITNNARYFSTACIKYSVSTFFQPVKETRSNEHWVIDALLKLLSSTLTRLGPCDKQSTIDHAVYQTLKNFTPLEKKQLKEILAKSDRNAWKLQVNNGTSAQPQKTLVSTY